MNKRYRYYCNSREYTVLFDNAVDSKGHKTKVVYQGQTGNVWTMDYDLFHGYKQVGDNQVKRFTLIDDK